MMKLFIINENNHYLLHSLFIFLLMLLTSISNVVVADTLTYSPDQWPRHWNVLINETQKQNNRYQVNGYVSQQPVRSPMWGVMPSAKQKPRRGVRPEYNTDSYTGSYPQESIYYQNYYSGFSGYGLANPYVSPLWVPGLMPGLNAPNIPFISNPYLGNPYLGNPYAGSPYMGGFPRPGYMW